VILTQHVPSRESYKKNNKDSNRAVFKKMSAVYINQDKKNECSFLHLQTTIRIIKYITGKKKKDPGLT
jgi:hypothetical protein